MLKRKINPKKYIPQFAMFAIILLLSCVDLQSTKAGQFMMDPAEYTARIITSIATIGVYLSTTIDVILRDKPDTRSYMKSVIKFAAVAIVVGIGFAVTSQETTEQLIAVHFASAMAGTVIATAFCMWFLTSKPKDKKNNPKPPKAV